MFDTNRKLTFEEVHAFLTAEGKPYRLNRNGGTYCCPTHDDNNPSLSVTVAADGKVLVHCWVCPKGEPWKFLWDRLKGYGEYRPTFTPAPPKKEKPKTRWVSLEAACAALESHHSDWIRAKAWWYVDAKGATVGAVVRWHDGNGQKEVRPYNRNADGWASGALDAPRPLYNLTALLCSDPSTRIYITEGEKAADAGNQIGWLTVTSAGGSKAARKTDWTPMRGRTVVVVPDNDKPGREYAEEVVELCNAVGAREVLLLDLGKKFPHLKEGGDLADLVESGEVTP